MIFRVPSYYHKFRCIADKCKDSCCIGWEIDIDEDTADYYRSVEGDFGKRLISHMVTEEADGEEDIEHFALEENGWCPFLNQNKLCDICIHLGEEALSEVCTEYPRFTMEYEDVREKVLCLSCEEVGRLVFSDEEKITWVSREISEDFLASEEREDGEEDSEGEDFIDEGEQPYVEASRLEEIRSRAVDILQERSKPIFLRAAEYLRYCEKMQRELDNVGYQVSDSEAEEQNAAELGGTRTSYKDFLARLESYEKLEVLDETWEQVKADLRTTFSEENYQESRREFLEEQKGREYEYEHLLIYFTFRYFMRAYYDANIREKAQFAVASVLMIRDMDVMRYLKNGRKFSLEDRIDMAKIYAKEVEHSEENMELLAEEFQFEEVFSVKSLLGQL